MALPGLPAVQFNIQDLQTPDGIERVLLQVQGQIQQIAQTEQPPVNVPQLAQQIWTINLQQLTALIQQQIQAAK
jgi:hypothetical protein